jgi:hypothetical protein
MVACVSGSTVRLYGSSATGFGLKQSDVNLELCVPPDKSPAKGLATAYDFIGSQEIYRYTLTVACITYESKS